jgi:hypothetical protein
MSSRPALSMAVAPIEVKIVVRVFQRRCCALEQAATRIYAGRRLSSASQAGEAGARPASWHRGRRRYCVQACCKLGCEGIVSKRVEI